MPLALQRRTQGYFPCRATLAESAVALTSTVPDSITLVVNAAPTAIWVAPLDGSPIILSATASDSDGSISQVDFYNGTTLIGTVLSGSAGDTGSGYTATWSNVAPGTYQLTAKATDNNGARVTTTPVTVTVNATAATIYYIHPDHLGTPRAITTSDTANTKVWEWKNEDAFGNNAPNEDPSATGTAFKYNLRFPGQYFDQETNTSYNYFRDYDSSLGRYIQSDPIGLAGGLSTFAYVGNLPLQYIDPLGLAPGGANLRPIYPPSKPSPPPPPIPQPTGPGVYLCSRPAQVASGLVDHYWIKTEDMSAGMGANPNVLPGQEYEGYGMNVQVIDHSKDQPTQCTKMNNVDEQCVNKELQLGKPIGRFLPPVNQCQSFAYSTINKCRTGPQMCGGKCGQP